MDKITREKALHAKRSEVGILGESIATKYLESKGFVTICRNYRKKYGEIDIITQKDGILHFVEVKSVSREIIDLPQKGNYPKDVFWGEHRPEDNIHSAKLKRIRRTIQAYLFEKFKENEPDWVFDAVTVKIDKKTRRARVAFLENLIL